MLSFDIKRLVPKFIQNDRNGYAMMKAIEVALNALCTVCANGIACYNDPDNMPEWRLNEMAWEYGATWYDSTASIAKKRSQIKNIQTVYRILGTKDAVNTALKSVFGDGFIQEWFEYSGDAYHYKAYTTDADALNKKSLEFMRIAKIVQPERCVIDNVLYYGAESTVTDYPMTGAAGFRAKIYAKAE